MKSNTFALVASIFLSASASAGQVGAGPVGTGSLAVGSAISPGTATEAVSETPLPGRVGRVVLPGDQAASVAAYLQSQPGTVTNGTLITAPTVFQDGTIGKIELDTGTGVLTMTRV